MKKAGLVFLCIAVFLLAAAGGGAWLYLTPRGALRPNAPEEVMQQYLDGHDRAWWREEYIRLSAPEVTEFEDAQGVAGRIFDAAAGEQAVTFREEAAADPNAEAVYILSVGDADLFRARLAYADGQWGFDRLEPLDTLHADTHGISVVLPEDASLTVNGVAVGEGYIVEHGLVYPDMSELELRFGDYPTRVRYAVSGLYEAPAVEVSRPGGVTLLRADGGEWEYTRADAAGYAFAVTAPQEAVVRVGEAVLGEENITGAASYATALSVPEELQALLPGRVAYAVGGLYSLPEITAALPDGTSLAGTETDGVLAFALPGTDELHERHHERVESFLRDLIDYGAGHSWSGKPGAYVAEGSGVSAYLTNASASLHWTVNVTLTFQDVSTSDYIPLGDGAFLCRGHADFTTKTAYQTKDISMDYEMLWLEQDGNWMLWDLAFA